jgi:O-acetyl-ADP-ribose deacetylase (regulator of RNase III)
MNINIVHADITTLSVDAIVNAANSTLLGGGGVDDAIHRGAGQELFDECFLLRKKQFPDGLSIGEAVITKGYNLPAKYIIHTVGPVYENHEISSPLLANAYRNSLHLAEKHQLQSIAFPAISTGVLGYPKQEAIQVVKNVLNNHNFESLKEITLCFYTPFIAEEMKNLFNS